jgi:molecular chaperone Hsp33
MIRSLGEEEAEGILAERGDIEVGCDFCGKQYHFDPVDVAQIFREKGDQPPSTAAVQ